MPKNDSYVYYEEKEELTSECWNSLRSLLVGRPSISRMFLSTDWRQCIRPEELSKRIQELKDAEQSD